MCKEGPEFQKSLFPAVTRFQDSGGTPMESCGAWEGGNTILQCVRQQLTMGCLRCDAVMKSENGRHVAFFPGPGPVPNTL